MNILQGEDNVISENAHGTCTEHMNTYQKYVTTDVSYMNESDCEQDAVTVKVYMNIAKEQINRIVD